MLSVRFFLLRKWTLRMKEFFFFLGCINLRCDGEKSLLRGSMEIGDTKEAFYRDIEFEDQFARSMS